MEQINLNQPEIWPKPIPFAAHKMGLALLGVLLLVGTVYGFLAYQNYRAEQRLTAVTEKRDRVQQQVSELRAALEEQKKEVDRLKQRLGEARDRLDAFRRAQELLEKRLQVAGGKDKLMAALGHAQGGVTGLWLTEFAFSGMTEVRIRVRGEASNAEAIPQFLDRLAARPVFESGFFDYIQAPPDGEGGGDGGSGGGGTEKETLSFESEAAFQPRFEEKGE